MTFVCMGRIKVDKGKAVCTKLSRPHRAAARTSAASGKRAGAGGLLLREAPAKVLTARAAAAAG